MDRSAAAAAAASEARSNKKTKKRENSVHVSSKTDNYEIIPFDRVLYVCNECCLLPGAMYIGIIPQPPGIETSRETKL